MLQSERSNTCKLLLMTKAEAKKSAPLSPMGLWHNAKLCNVDVISQAIGNGMDHMTGKIATGNNHTLHAILLADYSGNSFHIFRPNGYNKTKPA